MFNFYHSARWNKSTRHLFNYPFVKCTWIGIITFNSVSYSNDGTNTALFRVGVTSDASMQGESFSASPGSMGEIDVDATSVTLLATSASQYVGPGETATIILDTNALIHQDEVTLGADGTTQQVVCWTAQGVGGPTSVSLALNWEEITL